MKPLKASQIQSRALLFILLIVSGVSITAFGADFTIDIRTVGYQEVPRRCIYVPNKHAPQHSAEDLHTHISYISEETIAVSYARDAELCASRHPSLHLLALFLDATNGNKSGTFDRAVFERTQSWSTLDAEGSLTGLNAERFIVVAGHVLSIETLGDNAAARLPLPLDSTAGVSIAPGRESLVVRIQSPGHVEYRRYNANLQNVATRPMDSTVGVLFPGKQFVVAGTYKNQQACWTIFFDDGTSRDLSCVDTRDQHRFTLLSNELYALTSGNAVQVRSVETGKIVFEKVFPRGSEISDVIAGEDAATFMVELDLNSAKRFESEKLHRGRNLLIFRTADGHLLLHKSFQADKWDWDCAISPKADRLAVLNGTTLSIFSIEQH